MFFSCVSFNASASGNEENILSSVADVFEEAVGKFVNFFAKCFNIILKTDETNIPKAAVASPSWEEFDGEVIETPDFTQFTITDFKNLLV